MSDAVTEPGVYAMDDATYHADPVPDPGSLSSSGARRLLHAPALFHHERTHPRPPTTAFNIGHAAHALVLGYGPELVVIDAPDWRTKDAKQRRDDAYAAGEVPLLPHEHAQVTAMAQALREHQVASALFDPQSGDPERSLFWWDNGVARRCRLDWLPHTVAGRMIVADYKTTVNADPAKFSRTAADFGYHQQHAWNLDGVRALGLHDDPAFVFVLQEKEPPYLVSVVELDTDAVAVGDLLNRRALELFAECCETGVWPGYSDEVEQVGLPGWYLRQHMDALEEAL